MGSISLPRKFDGSVLTGCCKDGYDRGVLSGFHKTANDTGAGVNRSDELRPFYYRLLVVVSGENKDWMICLLVVMPIIQLWYAQRSVEGRYLERGTGQRLRLRKRWKR